MIMQEILIFISVKQKSIVNNFKLKKLILGKKKLIYLYSKWDWRIIHIHFTLLHNWSCVYGKFLIKFKIVYFP